MTLCSRRDTAPELSASDEQNIQKELDSITFYIENDYNELAEKRSANWPASTATVPDLPPLRSRIGAEVEEKPQPARSNTSRTRLGIDEIRSEFGLESC
jgi:hypothetical protein